MHYRYLFSHKTKASVFAREWNDRSNPKTLQRLWIASLRSQRRGIGMVCVVLFAYAVPASAAQITIGAPAGTVGVGDSFIMPVTLDTQGEHVNALEGTLWYPRALVELKEIRDGNSILNLWAQRPYDTSEGVRFAGIVPGGFAGQSGEVFTLVFEARTAGTVRYALNDAQALLNDGNGTRASLSIRAHTFSITQERSGAQVKSLTESDHTPPESFTPIIASDASIFDGKLFITFATQDKGSGIDQYEIAEEVGFKRATGSYANLVWHAATSPYLVADQAQHSYVYVKAIDRAGNERVETLSPIYLPFYYDIRYLLAILIVSLLAAGAVFYAYFQKHTRFP